MKIGTEASPPLQESLLLQFQDDVDHRRNYSATSQVGAADFRSSSRVAFYDLELIIARRASAVAG